MKTLQMSSKTLSKKQETNTIQKNQKQRFTSPLLKQNLLNTLFPTEVHTCGTH